MEGTPRTPDPYEKANDRAKQLEQEQPGQDPAMTQVDPPSQPEQLPTQEG